MVSKRVIIVGGGFGGLAAGVALSEQGHHVTLLEKRKHLGGRAYSFLDPKTNCLVDNGQHLFMGCYRETIAFLKQIGCLDRLAFQDRLHVDYLDATNGLTTFNCPNWPAPLHLLAGLWKTKGLRFADKLSALYMGRVLRATSETPETNATVTAWLDQHRQSANLKTRFWNPIAIATLNESPDTASATMMAKVVQAAFGGSRADSRLGIARVGLSDLYTDAARRFIEARGGHVRTATQAEALVIESGKVVAVEVKGGEHLTADAFILAVPHTALLALLPDRQRRGEFAALSQLAYSPILSLNLWFDRPLIEHQFVGLLGTKIQWLFNKDLIAGNSMNQGFASQPSSPRPHHLAIIISAAREFMNWRKEQLIELALKELGELLPASRAAHLLHSLIVKEREATIAHTVASDALRPASRTSVTNLFLAGDWINTGLPATIESAVLSGRLAAQLVDE